MSYLNLHTAAVTDPVDVKTALNDNWDEIDSKFALINSKSSPVGTGVSTADPGIEFVSSETTPAEIGVYTDTVLKKIQTVSDDVWGAWTNITLSAGFSAVSGRTPQLKISSLGKVACRGAIQYGTGTTAWPTGYNIVNDNQFNYAATVNRTICRNIPATPLTGGLWAMAQVYITANSTFMRMQIVYSGSTAASGNRVALDGLGWVI